MPVKRADNSRLDEEAIRLLRQTVAEGRIARAAIAPPVLARMDAQEKRDACEDEGPHFGTPKLRRPL
jgi:hypothetical protein